MHLTGRGFALSLSEPNRLDPMVRWMVRWIRWGGGSDGEGFALSLSEPTGSIPIGSTPTGSTPLSLSQPNWIHSHWVYSRWIHSHSPSDPLPLEDGDGSTDQDPLPRFQALRTLVGWVSVGAGILSSRWRPYQSSPLKGPLLNSRACLRIQFTYWVAPLK